MIDNAKEWFIQVLDSNTLLWASLAVWPLVFLLIVVHELGHALVALACTDSLVLVSVGRAPGVVRGASADLHTASISDGIITPKTRR
jgi:hypothetical protein